jgi:hypothetical protein
MIRTYTKLTTATDPDSVVHHSHHERPLLTEAADGAS